MKLSEHLTATKTAPRAFAAATGVCVQTLYRYMSGDRTPRPKVQARISVLTNGAVQPNDWVDLAASRAGDL